MKKLSIKTKVTLWYSGLMTIIVIIILIFLLGISTNIIRANTETHLKTVVHNSGENIKFREGKLNFGNDLSTFQNGVYISVYDFYGNLLFGNVPKVFNIDTPFIGESAQLTRLPNDEQLYHYETEITLKDYGVVWVRGVVLMTTSGETTKRILQIAGITLTISVLFILWGGYFVTKKSFEPVEQIRKSAEQISQGDDLSLRINLGEGNDEIYTLASTFDQMIARLQQLFEREKQFTSDVSHELRTPLAVIKTQVEYGLEHSENVDELKTHLKIIGEQSEKMNEITTQLLALARAERGNLPVEKERINLSELLEIVAEEQENSANQKNITIVKEIEPDVFTTADQTLSIRLFTNLITNAIDYGKDQGKLWVKLKKEKDRILCTVKDNGIGIAENELENIWKRFYQINPSRSGQDKAGAGLGLAMVSWIAKAHDWTVILESVENKGTEINIRIPTNL